MVNFRKVRIFIKARKLHIDSTSVEWNIKSFMKVLIPAGKRNKFFRPDLFTISIYYYSGCPVHGSELTVSDTINYLAYRKKRKP